MKITTITALTFFLISSLLIDCNVHAEPFTVSIPGQMGRIAFDFPKINRYKGQYISDKRFEFVGISNSVEGEVVLDFFVEPFPTGNHVSCRDTYLAKIKSHPIVKQETIKTSDREKYAMTTYVSDGEFEGEYIKAAHANFYLVNNGSCIDVHVSKHPYQSGDEQIVSKVGDSLKWIQDGK